MKESTYLKRLRTLDRAFIDREISQKTYEMKRRKLTKQWLKGSKVAKLGSKRKKGAPKEVRYV